MEETPNDIFVKENFKMEIYENKELLKAAVKQSLESLKDLEPGTDEYNNKANMALKLYDMQLKDEVQENDKLQKEDEFVQKKHELDLDREKTTKARRIEIAKLGLQALTFVATVGTTIYWSVCEAGGVMPLSKAMNEGMREIKRGFTK